MEYLRDLQYYEDQYDLYTIKECLRHVDLLRNTSKEIHTRKELDHLSEGEKDNQFGMLGNWLLMNVKIQRYKDRESRIEEWVQKDREKQNLQDNTPEPKNIMCTKCNRKMIGIDRHLSSFIDSPDRVLFFFKCDDCNSRKLVYENGEERERKPQLCELCNSELIIDLQEDKGIETWTTSCTSCDYQEVETVDRKLEEQKRKKEDSDNKNLLKKYRNTYCLGKEEAESLIQSIEELRFANEVYRHELQKYDTPEYHQVHNLRKLNVSQIEELLNNEIETAEFGRLTFETPVLGRYIEVKILITRSKQE